MPIDYPNEAALGSSASQGLPAFSGPQYAKIVEMIDAINNGGGGGGTDILYADLLALYNAGTMVVGFYNITDVEQGVIIEAVSSSSLASNGTGLFLNPDFQSVGDYSGVSGLTGVAYTSTQGVWSTTGEASYTNGMVVFWGGDHYQVIDAGVFDGNNPSANSSAYQILPKTTANVGYILEADYIEYNFESNIITRRVDRRGNDVIGQYNYQNFQWGNNNATDNYVIGQLSCINSVCITMIGNIINAGVSVTGLETFNSAGSGTFNYNRISNSQQIFQGNVISVSLATQFNMTYFENNTMDCVKNVDFISSNINYFLGETLSGNTSTFREIIDLAGATSIVLGAMGSYVGRIDLQDTTANSASIIAITDVPYDRTVRIFPDIGLASGVLAVTFVNNDQGGGFDKLHCIGNTNVTITSANQDWIEFTRQTKLQGFTHSLFQTAIGTYSTATTPPLPATNITYAALVTLYNAGTMVPGFYKITDRADAGIVIQAISASKLALNGTGLFLNPDFQDVGNYSGTTALTGFAKGTNYKVWVDTDEGAYANGDIVFWDGLHYQVIDVSLLPLATNPSVTPDVYTVLPKATANMGYISEADGICFDIIADVFFMRSDRRGNIIGLATSGFQFGNDLLIYNVALSLYTRFDILNNKCSAITSNSFTNAFALNISNNNTGFVSGNSFNSGVSETIVSVLNDLTECVIDAYENANGITLPNTPYSTKRLSSGFSNFDETLAIDAATTLDVTIAFNFVGILNLTSANATESIDLFANFPTYHPVRFSPESGLTVTFVHATGADQPICAGGVDAVINGTTASWIEFTRKETYVGSGVFRIYETDRKSY